MDSEPPIPPSAAAALALPSPAAEGGQIAAVVATNTETEPEAFSSEACPRT